MIVGDFWTTPAMSYDALREFAGRYL